MFLLNLFSISDLSKIRLFILFYSVSGIKLHSMYFVAVCMVYLEEGGSVYNRVEDCCQNHCPRRKRAGLGTGPGPGTRPGPHDSSRTADPGTLMRTS